VTPKMSAPVQGCGRRPQRRRGRIPEGLFEPGTVTVPLRSRRKASPLWIILLLVSGRTDHGPIRVKPNAKGASGAAAAALVIASPARKSVSRRRSYRLRRLGHTFKFDTARFESSQPSQPPGSL